MKKKTNRSRTTTTVNRTRNRTRARRPSAPAAAEFLETPLAMDSSPTESPMSTVFGNTAKQRRGANKSAAISPAPPLFATQSRRPPMSLGSISDLKDMASSRLEDVKRHVDASHVVIVKELDASHSRIH